MRTCCAGGARSGPGRRRGRGTCRPSSRRRGGPPATRRGPARGAGCRPTRPRTGARSRARSGRARRPRAGTPWTRRRGDRRARRAGVAAPGRTRPRRRRGRRCRAWARRRCRVAQVVAPHVLEQLGIVATLDPDAAGPATRAAVGAPAIEPDAVTAGPVGPAPAGRRSVTGRPSIRKPPGFHAKWRWCCRRSRSVTASMLHFTTSPQNPLARSSTTMPTAIRPRGTDGPAGVRHLVEDVAFVGHGDPIQPREPPPSRSVRGHGEHITTHHVHRLAVAAILGVGLTACAGGDDDARRPTRRRRRRVGGEHLLAPTVGAAPARWPTRAERPPMTRRPTPPPTRPPTSRRCRCPARRSPSRPGPCWRPTTSRPPSTVSPRR